MSTQALFHIMPEQAGDSATLRYACVLAANCYRQQQKVFIFTDSQQQAHEVDEVLWSFEPDSFVPHNLVGEGPTYGAPVEIGFSAPKGKRPVLINLSANMPAFAGQFAQVLDFVPVAEADKQQARERFKSCRQMGFQVDTVNVSA
ncbi:MAG: DNA polymerase III subunit chi [Thalassotalea sp.]|nr:DNA polymerase III subunit chi [Thalassotalea sp.]